MSGNTKVLTGLKERRALEAEFMALAEAADPDEVAQQATTIAAHGSAALTVLLSRLDIEDPRVRGGLGEVAKRLERDQIVAALRSVARSGDRSDQARLGAMTILARYLDEPVDESLLLGMQDPDDAAPRSLRELIQAMDRDEAAIIEYLHQLAEQPAEVAGIILDAIPRASPHPHLVTLLRMFAQSGSQPIARSAIEQLGRLRSEEALLALDTLADTLPPDLSALAERNCRKLRFSGVREPAKEAVSRRALCSPVDGSGAQLIWFISRPVGQHLSASLTVIVRDPEGIVASFGAHGLPGDKLPPIEPSGHVHILAQEEGALPLQLLEATFDAGRRAVRRALARHWKANTLPPLEYRLLNPLIWGGEWVDEAASPEPGPYSTAQMAALLDHPAFADWFWRDDALLDIARRFGSRQPVSARTKQISELASAHFDSELVASYGRRLEMMADWLAIAGQTGAAALAMSMAVGLAESVPAESPFVRRLVGMTLDMAAVALQAKQI